MFFHQLYPAQVPANDRPRRSQIHVEEAIRHRLHIPLGKVHIIISKLEKIGDWEEQDVMTDSKAGLVISAKLTGLSIDDLKVMQNFWRNILPRSSSSRNSRNLMNPALAEVPRTLVDLLVGLRLVRFWTAQVALNKDAHTISQEKSSLREPRPSFLMQKPRWTMAMGGTRSGGSCAAIVIVVPSEDLVDLLVHSSLARSSTAYTITLNFCCRLDF